MRVFLLVLLVVQTLCYNFYWYDKTQTRADRPTMVHLFEWRWTDIKKECVDFLQYNGYGAIQISPPMEHVYTLMNNDLPWWVRYQPVSYNLESRSGTEAEFKDMVQTCNSVGVRIVVDAVLNHMVGVGQKSGVNGVGSSGSSSFDGTHGVQNFPGVPYGINDFDNAKCDGDIQGSDYQNNPARVKNCRLVGLLDLNQNTTYVQNQIRAYLNKLIDYGVAGFRLDAAKHMWPVDLLTILNGLKNLNPSIFGENQRPFVFNEVIDRGGESVKCGDYLGVGRYTNFNFGAAVSQAAKGQQDWRNLRYLGPTFGYGNYEDNEVVNFIDNHDNQRDDNPYVVNYKDGYKYELANAFMLAWPYGFPKVMSSYYFSEHNKGPPNAGASSGFRTTSPSFNPDQTCSSSSGFVCEHRWPRIREMSKFRGATNGAAAAELVTEANRIAFARDLYGFFALNAQQTSWNKIFQTTLPAGDYCDHYTGGLNQGKCAGSKITVNSDGTAFLSIDKNSVVAFSMASRIGGSVKPAGPPSGWEKTVVLIKKQTYMGQNLFIRGGTANIHQCKTGPYMQESDPCAIPIYHNTTVPFVYAEYLTWSQQDKYLDFEGAEEKQGTHDGYEAFGTPLAYSTNDRNAVEYQPLNTFGAGYYLVQMFMDCSKAEQGWFELKGYVSPDIGWESDVAQSSCSGSIGGSAPFRSINHVAKCGALNVFEWNSGSCIVNRL